MSFRFATQKLNTGLYEPEGIYLQSPFEGTAEIGVGWGEFADEYNEFHYNGIPLKGHNGIDFIILPNTKIFATDRGRVIEVGMERGGYERYLKIEHRWGESFYAFLDEIVVESGQLLERGATIATAGGVFQNERFFHFAVRISPFNRLDGFGGFVDPLPFMNPSDIILPEAVLENGEAFSAKSKPLHQMLIEKIHSRRP